jgi:excisionase family DNA binding protein
VQADDRHGTETTPETNDGEGAFVEGSARVVQQELFTVHEAMEMLSLSRTVIYEQLRNGRLRYVKQGRATRITAAAIKEYIALLEKESEVRYARTA